MRERLWEVDVLRGVAIILMVVYHLIYDLDFFDIGTWDAHTVPALVVGRTSAVMFLTLVGISLTLSHSRYERGCTRVVPRGKYVKRGAGIFGLGILASVVVWLFLGEWYLVFGVLHLIGLSIIITHPLIRRPVASALIGSTLVVLGVILPMLVQGNYWTLAIGLRPEGVFLMDYYPILPWMGVVLIGISLGNALYPMGQRRCRVRDLSRRGWARGLGWMGRHSLVIYLLHQPVIIGLMVLAGVA